MRTLHQIADYVDSNNLEAYYRVYKFIKKTNNKVTQRDLPIKEIQQLAKVLDSLEQSDWLAPYEATQILDSILSSCRVSIAFMYFYIARKSVGLNAKHGRRKLIPTGRPQNYAMDFIIHALMYDLKKSGCRNKYENIAGYLNEKQITDDPENRPYSYSDVRKRYKRITERAAVKIAALFTILDEPGYYHAILKHEHVPKYLHKIVSLHGSAFYKTGRKRDADIWFNAFVQKALKTPTGNNTP